jgi:tetratricopeptide (TPR) repeat protein
VIRELGSPAGFERVRPHLASTFTRWRREWSPERAAFALEIALTAFAHGWPNPPTYLNAARDLVVARPAAPGAAPDQDAFELRFHRAAVALLAALDGPNAVDAYLATIQHRVAVGDTVPESAVLTDARLLLARAAAREVQTLRLLASAGSIRDVPWAWAVSKDDNATRRRLEEVDALLDRASTDDDTRAEASVRRAFIRHRLGQHQNALVLLTAAAPTDAVVVYWRALIQGRILAGLGREQDAINSFERASAQAPDAQTPAVALSTMFLKRGDRKQAFHWAERSRTTNENGVDPWPLYWGGAARFLAPWVTDLRELAR